MLVAALLAGVVALLARELPFKLGLMLAALAGVAGGVLAERLAATGKPEMKETT
ncbi:hypothetical protein D3C78_1982890 [compost metagenome]